MCQAFIFIVEATWAKVMPPAGQQEAETLRLSPLGSSDKPVFLSFPPVSEANKAQQCFQEYSLEF